MKKGKKRTQNGNPLSEQFRIPYADVASKGRRSDGQGAGEVEFTRAAPPLEIAVNGRNGHLVGRDGDSGVADTEKRPLVGSSEVGEDVDGTFHDRMPEFIFGGRKGAQKRHGSLVIVGFNDLHSFSVT